ncbi:MAG: phosphatase PAP2 family protein, partial [Gemmatimonadaceae bacterium]
MQPTDHLRSPLAVRAPRLAPRNPRLDMAPLRLTALAGAVAFLALAGVVARGNTRTFDRAVRRRVLGRQGRGGRAAMAALTVGGESAVHVCAALLGALAIARRRGPRAGGAVALSSLGALATHNAVKLVLKRRRPLGALLRGKREPSFPSGHTTASTAVAATIAYAVARERIIASRHAAAIAVAVSALVGASRVSLDEHWATDVFGGWAGGITV